MSLRSLRRRVSKTWTDLAWSKVSWRGVKSRGLSLLCPKSLRLKNFEITSGGGHGGLFGKGLADKTRHPCHSGRCHRDLRFGEFVFKHEGKRRGRFLVWCSAWHHVLEGFCASWFSKPQCLHVQPVAPPECGGGAFFKGH